MGRLSTLILLALPALVGCDKSDAAKGTASAGRSEVVQATGNMPTAAPTPTVAASHAAPAAPRKLCQGDTTVRTLPKGPLSRAQVSGAAPVEPSIPVGGGKFTWLNFFAAWCGPCKEEIPRLRTWEKKLADAGTPVNLVFVSVDDDERQLTKFLEAQPAGGVKAALWLKDGMRDGWLASMKMKNPPDLPEHALIDPSGKVSCVIEGALDDVDYPQFSAYVARR